MTVSFDGIKAGDWVQAEFASPVAGFIFAEVHEVFDDELYLRTGGEVSSCFIREDLSSVSTCQPPKPAVPGTLVWFTFNDTAKSSNNPQLYVVRTDKTLKRVDCPIGGLRHVSWEELQTWRGKISIEYVPPRAEDKK